MSIGEYHRLVPSETAFPVHMLSDNTLFQTQQFTLPIFDDFLNQALQSLLHRQQLKNVDQLVDVMYRRTPNHVMLTLLRLSFRFKKNN